MALYFALTVSNASMMHVRGMVPLNFMGSDALCSDAVGGMQFMPAVTAGGTHVDAIGSRLELLVAVAPFREGILLCMLQLLVEGVNSARARFREGWCCSWVHESTNAAGCVFGNFSSSSAGCVFGTSSSMSGRLCGKVGESTCVSTQP